VYSVNNNVNIPILLQLIMRMFLPDSARSTVWKVSTWLHASDNTWREWTQELASKFPLMLWPRFTRRIKLMTANREWSYTVTRYLWTLIDIHIHKALLIDVNFPWGCCYCRIVRTILTSTRHLLLVHIPIRCWILNIFRDTLDLHGDILAWQNESFSTWDLSDCSNHDIVRVDGAMLRELPLGAE